MKPYEQLVYAIIEQAAKDYQYIAKQLTRKRARLSWDAIQELEAELSSIEDFFLHGDYLSYMGIDGTVVLNRLKGGCQ